MFGRIADRLVDSYLRLEPLTIEWRKKSRIPKIFSASSHSIVGVKKIVSHWHGMQNLKQSKQSRVGFTSLGTVKHFLCRSSRGSNLLFTFMFCLAAQSCCSNFVLLSRHSNKGFSNNKFYLYDRIKVKPFAIHALKLLQGVFNQVTFSVKPPKNVLGDSGGNN